MGKSVWKRLLSAFLCVCMVAMMAPVAFAAGEETTTVSTSEELVRAIVAASDGDTITLGEGTFSTYQSTSPEKSLTFVGAGSDKTVWKIGNIPAQDKEGEYNSDNSFGGCDTITFKNMKMVNGTKDYMGFTRINNLNFENCVFEGRGSYWGYQTTTFSNCTFTAPAGAYAITDYTSTTMTLNNCTLNSASGKFINAYGEQDNNGRTLNFADCTFNADEKNKPAVCLKSFKNTAWKLNITRCVTNFEDVTLDADDFYTDGKYYSVRTKDNNGTCPSGTIVTVDGKTVWKNGAPAVDVAEVNGVAYTSLADAVAAANDGETVTLLKDIDLGSQTLTVNKSVIIDGGNSKYAIESTNRDVVTVTAASNTVTLSNLTLKAYNAGGRAIAIAESGDGLNLTIDNCVIETKQRGLTVNSDSASMNLTVKDSTISLVKSDGSAYDYDTEYVNSTTRGLSLWQMQNSQVNIVNTTIQGFAYDVNNSGNSETTDTMTVNITGCTLKGRAGINDWTRGTTWNVTNTKFHGINNEKGPSESFGCIVFNSGAENNNCNVNNCSFSTSFNETGKENEKATEYMFAIRANGNNITVDRDVVSSDTSYMIMGNLTAKGGICEKGIKGNTNTSVVKLYGGFYNVDPSDYCADGLTGVPSGNTTYPWTVGTKSETKADVAVGAPDVSEPDVTYPNNSAEKTLLDSAQTALTGTAPAAVTGTGIETAASVAANNNTVKAEDVVSDLNDAIGSGSSVTANNTNIVIQTYMDMKITGVDATADKQSISVDIQPMYRTVATTADVNSGGEIVLEADGSQTVNAVRIGQPQKLEVQAGYPVEVMIPVPDSFVTDAAHLVVKHEKNGKLVGYHDATYNSTAKTIKFTNDKGFSTFTVLSDARSASVQFTDKDGNNIDTAVSYGPSNVNDALPTTAAESGYVFNGWKFEGIDGVYTTLTDELLTALNGKTNVKATPDFSKRSSGSSGGSSSNTFKVTTSSVNNGGVNASPSNASKGATITITLSPDKGYKLDKLTVTDGSGKTISTTKKSDTVYTFTMPSSAVKVSVSYTKDDSAVVEPTTGFDDVAAAAWYANAVKYAVDKGMMNGVGGNKFAPDGVTNRGMIVTVLYRLENEPTASAASFTDVASGAYYANAVAWASANGIVTGYGSGKFGPNDAITREQFAAILYRYAQYKKYDVSAAASLDGYTDAQSVSSYAVPAVQWACGAGVMNGSNGRLTPKSGATRAQAAQLLMNFCENAAK